MKRSSLLIVALCCAAAMLAATTARAADAVKIGVLMPLTGNAAAAGQADHRIGDGRRTQLLQLVEASAVRSRDVASPEPRQVTRQRGLRTVKAVLGEQRAQLLLCGDELGRDQLADVLSARARSTRLKAVSDVPCGLYASARA